MNYKAIYQRLADDPAIAAIVGNRIYHDAPARNSTYPYIVFSNLTGSEVGEVEYATRRYQIDLVSGLRPNNGALSLETLQEAVINNLKGFRGTMGSGGNTQIVKSVEYSGNSGVLKLPDNEGKQVSLDFLFHYLRS